MTEREFVQLLCNSYTASFEACRWGRDEAVPEVLESGSLSDLLNYVRDYFSFFCVTGLFQSSVVKIRDFDEDILDSFGLRYSEEEVDLEIFGKTLKAGLVIGEDAHESDYYPKYGFCNCNGVVDISGVGNVRLSVHDSDLDIHVSNQIKVLDFRYSGSGNINLDLEGYLGKVYLRSMKAGSGNINVINALGSEIKREDYKLW